ncbi:MAG: hypothetical protein RI897_3739 [Verrucomicrobiota bacterium]|jgi:N-glycosylase/DNA lyase
MPPSQSTSFPLNPKDYDLSATLDSGQAFGWTQSETGTWTGVIGCHWVQLSQSNDHIHAQTCLPQKDWHWLSDYLQLHFNLKEAIHTFPADAPLEIATRNYPGLHLLRQDPWTCLASFILSSTKQIVQIQQVYHLLCQQYGAPVPTPPHLPQAHTFPTPQALAHAGETALRDCRMGFRAKYLHQTATQIANGNVSLESLRSLPLNEARRILTCLPGVGPKIADCALLFSCDQPRAFPIDVWIARTLRNLYFKGQPTSLPKLQDFAEQHFGPFAGLAQQYLFHEARRPKQPKH